MLSDGPGEGWLTGSCGGRSGIFPANCKKPSFCYNVAVSLTRKGSTPDGKELQAAPDEEADGADG